MLDVLNVIYLIYLTLAVQSIPLSFCFLMDFPIQINTIRMGMSIMNFKGSQVEISK